MGDQPFPFGPSLAVGVAITLAAWPTLGGQFQPLFFDPTFLGLLAVAGGVIFVVVCFLLRLLRGV